MTTANEGIREVRAIAVGRGRVWLGGDGILRHDVDPDETIDLELAKTVVAAFADLSVGRRLPLRVLLSRRGSLSSEARAHLVSDEAERTVAAVALVQTSRVAAMVANIFLAFKEARYPIRLFADEDAALLWL